MCLMYFLCFKCDGYLVSFVFYVAAFRGPCHHQFVLGQWWQFEVMSEMQKGRRLGLACAHGLFVS